MLGFEVREEFASRAIPPLCHIVKSLPDAFASIRLRGDIQQPLIRGGILHDSRSLSLYSQNYWTLRRLQLLEEVAGTSAKRG